MTSKNTVFTLTPPDMQLSLQGPSILMLGIPFDEIAPYIKIYDKMFPDIELTFFTSETGINSENLAWYRMAAGQASSAFVNLDNITKRELMIAMQLELDRSDVAVFWVSPENKNEDLRRLLNSFSYQVFDSIEDMEEFIAAEYAKYR